MSLVKMFMPIRVFMTGQYVFPLCFGTGALEGGMCKLEKWVIEGAGFSS